MGKGEDVNVKVAVEGELAFKSSLEHINAGLKVNKSELALVTAQYGKNATGMDALTAKSNALQGAIASQTTKVTLLKDALEKSVQAHGKSGDQTMKLEKDYNNAQAALFKMNRELDQNDAAMKKVQESSRSLTDAITGIAEIAGIRIPPAMQGMINKLDGVSASGAALVGVLAGTVVALGKMTFETSRAADDILTLSSTTGLSTDALQEFNYASELLDVSAETTQGSLTKMIRSMVSARDGTQSVSEAYGKLHINVLDGSGALRDANTVFFEAIDALGKISNETERDAISMQIFGKSARELNPLIESGSVKLRALAKEAHNVGYVMDGETLESFGRLDDAMQRAGKQIDTVKMKLSLALLPVLTKSAELLSSIHPNVILVTGGIVVLSAVITGVAKSVTALNGAYTLLTVKKAADTAATVAQAAATGAAGVAQTGLNVAMNACPVMLLVTGIGLLIGAAALFIASQREARSETEKLSEKVLEQAEQYHKLQQAAAEKSKADDAEVLRIIRLREELGTLVDSQGFIIRNSERAKQIIDELNGIMPGSIEWIQKGRIAYEDQGKAIDNMITKKRLQIVLESEEAGYRQALLNLGDIELDQVNRKIQLDNETLKLEGMKNDAWAITSGRVSAQVEKMKGLQSEYQQGEEFIRVYHQNIASYESKATLLSSDNYGKMNRVLENYGKNYKTVSSATQQELANQVDVTGTLLLQQKDRLSKGYSGITQETINSAKNGFLLAVGEYEKAGGNLMNGVKDGWQKNEESFLSVVKDTIKKARDAAKGAAEIHSPSRMTAREIGKPMMQGVLTGWNQYAPEVMRGVSGTLRKIATPSVNMPISYINNAVTGKNASFTNSTKMIAATPTAPVTENYYITLDAHNVQDFNSVVKMAKAAEQQRRAR